MMPLISLCNLSKDYRNGENTVSALKNVSLDIEKGEFVTIIGRSGSGKSTLMNILGCLDTQTSGEYFLNGKNVASLGDRKLSRIRNEHIGFIFQGFNLVAGLSALENVELPLFYRGIGKTESRRRALLALKKVGLLERMHHFPCDMSGGQQQRVAIARAIAGSPPVILADEPTGNLDTACGQEIMETLFSLHAQGHTVIVITHDPLIAQTAARVITVCDGVVC